MLKGKVALVTGGTRGIGRGIAQKFAEQGAIVYVVGQNSERGEKAALELRTESGNNEVHFMQLDVADTAAVESSIKSLIAEHKKIDVLVNNAGITADQLLMKLKEEDWDRVMDVNLKSCFNTCKALAFPMIKARGGSIINISSVVGLTGNAGQANYAASKAGMIGFTKSIAQELAARGVRANCIAPGFITTDMTDELNDEQRKSIFAQIPMGKMGDTEDIANAALFLASDMAKYVTGQVLTVDGGMVM
ncbi:MAG: 3-oxoacyl-ACP reductase [Waddliaceae bacterium]|nr:3-oxoacyl-ACP reductase [Waddliaceae bacterium]